MRVELRTVARVWLLHTQVHVASLGAHTQAHVASLGAGSRQHMASSSTWPVWTSHGEATDDFCLHQRLLGFSEHA